MGADEAKETLGTAVIFITVSVPSRAKVWYRSRFVYAPCGPVSAMVEFCWRLWHPLLRCL